MKAPLPNSALMNNSQNNKSKSNKFDCILLIEIAANPTKIANLIQIGNTDVFAFVF